MEAATSWPLAGDELCLSAGGAAMLVRSSVGVAGA